MKQWLSKQNGELKKKINKEMKLMLLIRLNGQDLIKSNQDYASGNVGFGLSGFVTEHWESTGKFECWDFSEKFGEKIEKFRHGCEKVQGKTWQQVLARKFFFVRI